MELPDDLYRKAKRLAADQKVPVRDLISEGLRTVLAAPVGGDSSADDVRQVLVALDDIMRRPPADENRTILLQAEVRRQRSGGWSAGETAS